MRLFYLCTFCFLAFFIIGCAGNSPMEYKSPISEQAKYDLEKPIDCSTAEADIKVLESEKVSSSEQAKAGVKSIVPAAAARGILHRDYIDRAKVASGEYNAEIDQKIQEIKNKCGK